MVLFDWSRRDKYREAGRVEGRGSFAEELLKRAEESEESLPDEIQEILKREAEKSKDDRK